MEGREPAAFPLPDEIERVPTDAAARPVLRRWRTEGPATRRVLLGARATGRPFDLVHTAHLPAPGRLGCPFSITIHDLRHLDRSHASRGRRTAAEALLRGAVRRAAVSIAVSRAVQDELRRRFDLEPERVRLVRNAADHFEPLPREPARDAPILCVGHLERRKNLDVLLRALQMDPGLPHLLLAGAAKGGEERRLRDLARELRVDSRVSFLGAFEDRELPRLYARAACVALPSRIEGFGIPALEAARARVPLAIARIPALVEVAGDTTPSFLPDDPGECARAIRAAIAAPKAELDRRAARAAEFSWQDSAEALVEAWRAAAG